MSKFYKFIIITWIGLLITLGVVADHVQKQINIQSEKTTRNR